MAEKQWIYVRLASVNCSILDVLLGLGHTG